MVDRAGAPTAAQQRQPPPTAVGRLLDRLVSVLAVCGLATLIVAIALTWADIVWRRVVGGAFVDIVDITRLCLTAAASFAIPYGFVRGSHVTVDIVAERLPPRPRRWLDAAVLLAAAALLALLLYLSSLSALQSHTFRDRTLNLGIPLIYYWSLFLAGLALSVLVALERAVRAAIPALAPTDGPAP